MRLILLLTNLLTIALACESFFHTLLFTGLQIKRMSLDFLDDVFSLHFALEAPQGILKGFAILYSNLCQEKIHLQIVPNRDSFQNTPVCDTKLTKSEYFL